MQGTRLFRVQYMYIWRRKQFKCIIQKFSLKMENANRIKRGVCVFVCICVLLLLFCVFRKSERTKIKQSFRFSLSCLSWYIF